MIRRLALCCIVFVATSPTLKAGWSEDQIGRLPDAEKPIHLFNGKDLQGWEGQTEKYFSVQDGVIVAKNSKDNAPQASTYLVTKKKYRNFRLIFEAKLVESEMHSGIALWGKTVNRKGDPFSYMGHLVMFPSGYGYYDLYRRNSIYRDTKRVARKAGKQHDWNRMEILAIGNRLQHVVNGVAVADWSDPKPEYCQPGPIGLQLHSNKVAQEVHFRGLILTEDPEDRLVTVAKSSKPVSAANAGEQISTRLNGFVKRKQISGAVTLFSHKGKVVQVDAVGKADVENDRPMTQDTIFAIASMTKPITATGLMILQDEGKLAVEDPVSKYLPFFADVALEEEKPNRPLTLRDLLTHTSGLQGSQRNDGSLKETVEKIAQRPLAFQPGTKWQYSPGLSVCGRVIEVVSGRPYEKFLAERIFEPLRMTDTTFFPNEEQQKRIARIYKPGKEKGTIEATDHWLSDISEQRTPNPSGGLFSTARDLANFYQMILNGGELNGKRVLSVSAVKQMTTVQSRDVTTGFTPGNGWGLGWCVVREPQGVTSMLSPGTFGHGGAFSTQGWVDPKRQMIFVLLIQRTGFGNSDASKLRGAFQRLAVNAVREKAK